MALKPWRQGLTVWALAAILALTLPGVSKDTPPAFPWQSLAPAGLALGLLALVAPLLVWFQGPELAQRRSLALWEAPPDLLWGALTLALWPRAWGPPGTGAWLLAFLAAALPSEARWLAQSLPAEHPFPQAWGSQAVKRVRALALRRLWGPWVAARLPLWLTATLVLEQLLGHPGLGLDWMTRAARRDQLGLLAWVTLLALLWALSRTWEEAL